MNFKDEFPLLNMNITPTPSAAASSSTFHEQDKHEKKIKRAVQSAQEGAREFVTYSSRAYLLDVLQDERVLEVVFSREAKAFKSIPLELPRTSHPSYAILSINFVMGRAIME